MEPLLLAVLLEMGFFLLLLILKGTSSQFSKICVLCAATVGVWLTLLILSLMGLFGNTVILAILMGGSCVGIVYMFEKHASRNSQIFKFPLYLTLVVAVYSVLQWSFVTSAIALVVLLWILSAVLFFGQKYPALKVWGEKIIACCKNW